MKKKKPVSKYKWQKQRVIDILEYCLERVKKDDVGVETNIVDLLYFDAVNVLQEMGDEEV